MRQGADDETKADENGSEFLSAVHGIERFRIEVVEGQGVGHSWLSDGERCAIGFHPSNDVVLKDRTVSRFHCEVTVHLGAPRVQDLESRNGTIVDGVRVERGWLRSGSIIRVGQTSLTFSMMEETLPLRLWPQERFQTMLGTSAAMRAVFSEMELAAAFDSTVLLEGESGTGKEEVAQSIHLASPRAKAPFVIVDCSAIPSTLLESELFGHEKGAFTGATERREGAFQSASKGTIFLDEIGELPQELQPKLLRAFESKAVRRLGARNYENVDMRIIAATNVNLRKAVNTGLFRSDLYYRLAVLKIQIPPLRQRPEDISILVEHFLNELGADAAVATSLATPEHKARMQMGAWPGNVRELRNYLERCCVHNTPLPLGELHHSAQNHPDPRLSYQEARRRALASFEQRYLKSLMQRHGGNVSEASHAAGINRAYFYKLLARHGITR